MNMTALCRRCEQCNRTKMMTAIVQQHGNDSFYRGSKERTALKMLLAISITAFGDGSLNKKAVVLDKSVKDQFANSLERTGIRFVSSLQSTAAEIST